MEVNFIKLNRDCRNFNIINTNISKKIMVKETVITTCGYNFLRRKRDEVNVIHYENEILYNY